MPQHHFCLRVALGDLRERAPGSPPVIHSSGFVAGPDGNCAADTDAVIGDAYERLGHALSREVLGQYAAMVVDRRAGCVLLVQDSLGVRPLFFALLDDTLWAASKLDLLITQIGPRPLDEAFIADFLAKPTGPPERTPWCGVERLVMGESALIGRDGRIERFRPWTPGKKPAECDDAPEPRLRALLDDALRACLPPERRVACELSGGLDSTTVLAFARPHAAVDTVTFVSSASPDADDVRLSEFAARHYGVRRLVIDTDRTELFKQACMAPGREPGYEMFADKLVQYDALLEREGHDVVLTGWAGDVVFGSAAELPHFLADGLVTGAPLASVRAIRRWARHYPQFARNRWLTDYALRSAWRTWRGKRIDPPDAKRGLHDWIAGAFAARQRLGARAEQWAGPRVRRPGAQYLWEAIYSIAAMHATAGRTQLGVETRHPLLHRPLVEFMLGLDSAMRHPDGYDRVLQRRALADILPPEISSRVSKGGMRGSIEREYAANRALCARLESNPARSLGIFAEDGWREAIRRLGVGASPERGPFDQAVAVQLWFQLNQPGSE